MILKVIKELATNVLVIPESRFQPACYSEYAIVQKIWALEDYLVCKCTAPSTIDNSKPEEISVKDFKAIFSGKTFKDYKSNDLITKIKVYDCKVYLDTKKQILLPTLNDFKKTYLGLKCYHSKSLRETKLNPLITDINFFSKKAMAYTGFVYQCGNIIFTFVESNDEGEVEAFDMINKKMLYYDDLEQFKKCVMHKYENVVITFELK